MENVDLKTEGNNANMLLSAVEFLKWCNTPVYRASGGLDLRLRVQPQFPEYDSYIVIDETGYSVFPKGKFLSAEELYEYWLNCR
jgi:hypothetical protein